jgi:hypothetical protein
VDEPGLGHEWRRDGEDDAPVGCKVARAVVGDGLAVGGECVGVREDAGFEQLGDDGYWSAYT